MPRLPRHLKHLFWIMVVILVAGCAGGGCSTGCSGCGMTPLPGGFDPNARIENAGSVRLTSSGLGFLEQNIGTLAKTLLGGDGAGGVLTFNIPTTSGSQFGIDYDVCPGGPNPATNTCVAEIDVGNAKLNVDATDPHNIHITGPLPLRIQNLPIEIVYFFVPDKATGKLTGNGCNNPPSFANINLDVDISIEVDTNMAHSRAGYSRVKINKMAVDEDALKNSLNFCGGGFSNSVLSGLKSILFGLLYDQLIGTLQDQIDQQLCQQANPAVSPACPLGTFDVEGTCRYANDANAECASIILGTDGHVDLGGLLASVSPGTKGGLDVLFAVGGPGKRDDNSGHAWGDLNPIGGGATLGMYGGAEPMPLSGCVPFSDMPAPVGIPIPDEITANTVTDWPADIAGPHVGIAVSERFANYALNGMYNSGLLCLGISTETVPQLSSGTLSLLAASLKDLGLQREQQQVALVIRPGKPPSVTFGNGTNLESDPLVRVKLEQASFDFYIWSLDRYIRFMTATFDLEVPVNLAVTPDGLLPVLEKINVTNGKVTNSELLREDPAVVAAALQGLIGGLAGQFLGGINPIDLSDALGSVGLTLTIPETVEGKGSAGLRRLSKGQDNYLGIFATLGIAPAQPFAPAKAVDTDARVISKEIDKAAFRIATARPENAPVVTLQMSSPLDTGAQAVEYSYRVDRGAWHPFTRERIVDVRDEWLRLQGKHVISVRSRIAGQPQTLDETPAEVEVVIDAEAPAIAVGEVGEGNKVALDVRDRISGGDEPLVRYRLDDGMWSEWKLASELARVDVGEASDIAIEAKDAEGNIAEAQQALIRGKILESAEGCGCSVVGEDRPSSKAAWLFALGMLGMVLRFGRRRSAKAPSPAPARPAAGQKARRALRALTGLAIIGAAGSFSGCSCGGDEQVSAQYHCDPAANPPCTTLEPGLIGAYTSVAVSGSTVWVAGYVEANWVDEYSWGDLAVGQWNGERVGWSVIDGVPADPPVDPAQFNKSAFRGGQTEAGDDVGLWTSIAVDDAGRPAVAYYDRTHRALKFAQSTASGWSVMTVETQPQSDIGRYAKLLFVGGKPVIAYLSIGPGENGAVTSKVRLAKGASAAPTESDWTFEDVAVNTATPCREYNCTLSEVCVADTGMCTKKENSDACTPKCSSGSACVDQGGAAACADIVDATKLDSYPEAYGDYVSMAKTPDGGVGIAFYDRIHTDLVIATKEGEAWKTLVVDGAAPDGADTGDMGIGSSLFIDDKGDWHLSYVDGLSEGLRYAQVTKGTTVKILDLADDGLTVDGATKFEDGQHLVGDDSRVYVSASGEIHITYQDATAGKLRYAVGTPSGDKITWKLRSIDQEGFAGAFSAPISVDGKLQLANWWRTGGQEPRGDVSIVSP
ncbi:MYXO-CTERM sorting domain-containing protein [Polyangium aurulentum]|uniref:MYXO-CTERM sorting domain-containing protein n=1 Tax=Polyangium aurulentum TaxID=2567896 RepID=UPI001F19F92A|nr:MYXO-CTERM sorting domain-containing protein [Polyangium aurulentum]